ncbi:hypothetical protein FM106_14595 [Brachybacterium faecium]|nr:hypothetical protein FM106_14595 [Brachybacterium faecium]
MSFPSEKYFYCLISVPFFSYFSSILIEQSLFYSERSYL